MVKRDSSMGDDGQPSGNGDQFPTIASSENFEVWDDPAGEAVVVAFNLNGVTIAINQADFDEFAQVIAEAARTERGLP